jgi:signal transduction histidine kinase
MRAPQTFPLPVLVLGLVTSVCAGVGIAFLDLNFAYTILASLGATFLIGSVALGIELPSLGWRLEDTRRKQDTDMKQWVATHELGQPGRSEAEVAVDDDLVARFGEASELELRVEVARALLNQGVALDQLGRSDEALPVYDDLVARFGGASEFELRVEVARALLHKGAAFDKLALAVATALHDLRTSLAAVYGAAQTLRRHDFALDEAGRNRFVSLIVDESERLNRIVNEILNQLGRSEEPLAVATALRELRTSLAAVYGAAQTLRRHDFALDEAERNRFVSLIVDESERLNRIVNEILHQLGPSDEALAVYDDLVARFGEASEPELREQVARAERARANLRTSKEQLGQLRGRREGRLWS